MKKRPKKPKNGKNKLSPRGEASPSLQPRHTTRLCDPRIGAKQSTPGLPFPPRLRALPLKTRLQKKRPRLPHPNRKRSSSACSARGQITAFGLYCPLSGQAFTVALSWHKKSESLSRFAQVEIRWRLCGYLLNFPFLVNIRPEED